MHALPSRKITTKQPRTHWRDYAEYLAWSRLQIPPAELPLLANDQDASRLKLELRILSACDETITGRFTQKKFHRLDLSAKLCIVKQSLITALDV